MNHDPWLRNAAKHDWGVLISEMGRIANRIHIAMGFVFFSWYGSATVGTTVACSFYPYHWQPSSTIEVVKTTAQDGQRWTSIGWTRHYFEKQKPCWMLLKKICFSRSCPTICLEWMNKTWLCLWKCAIPNLLACESPYFLCLMATEMWVYPRIETIVPRIFSWGPRPRRRSFTMHCIKGTRQDTRGRTRGWLEKVWNGKSHGQWRF